MLSALTAYIYLKLTEIDRAGVSNEAGVRLLDEKMLNAVLVLLVVTSILGPIMTELFTPRMIKQEARKGCGGPRKRDARRSS
jgi:hypothetical protein